MRDSIDRVMPSPVSVEPTWEWISDLTQVAGAVRMLTDVQVLDPGAAYHAVLMDRVGPFRLRADLDIRVNEWAAPRRMRLSAAGEDQHVGSRIVVDGLLEVVEEGTGAAVRLSGTYEVTGTVASMGGGTIRKKVDAMLDDLARGLGRLGAQW